MAYRSLLDAPIQAKDCVGPQRGYDYDFIEEPSDDLKCLICLCVARDPQQHGDGGCGKIFCRSCIEQHKKTKNKCPQCRRLLSTFKDERSERDIQSLKLKCENFKKGCHWIGELRSAEGHLKTCGYVEVQCNYNCGQEELYRKDLEKHEAQDCPHRLYNCPHCSKCGEYKDITSHKHINVCPKFVIACPNAPNCKKSFPRENKEKHVSTCGYQMTHCKYSELGCDKMVMRKDLPEHESDDKVHLSDAMKTVLSLKQQCSLQALQLHNLSTKSQTSILKMSNFSKKRKENIEFFSDPFSTHPYGYEMVLNVSLNGYHISVWVYLMRGEYDDQLEFPFKGTITIELLNQLEDNYHHSESYTHDGTEDSSQRVLRSNRSRNAQGVHNFISHKKLGYHTIENCKCQYLKDDCLVFRILVDTHSYKPWLQCSDIKYIK